ncbi:MAG: hypothetical protein OER86_05275, partial [Phycisphaerae bacterium]|nr:hypothetical protein [Phycisphaerae bacterium]
MVDELSFNISNDRPDLVTISIVNGQIQAVSSGDTEGTANIVITATDLQGNSVQDAFSIDIVVPEITLADVLVGENAGTATITLDLSHSSSDTISIDYTTTNGTAEAGSDYTAKANTLTFNPGQVQRQIDISLSSDALLEFNETFTVDFSNLAGLATMPEMTATVTIDDADSDQVDFAGSTAGVFTDDDGDEVKLSLRGEGTGRALLPVGGVGDPILVRLDGTDTRSSFSASARGGGGETNITDFQVEGSLNGLSAKVANLLGDLSVTGWAKKIQLKNVLDDHNITIGAPDTDKDAVTLTFGRVGDLVLSSQTPIKSLTAIEWKDFGGPDDSITAPWMGSLKIKGDKKLAIDGDFEADLVLSGVGAPKQTLKSAKIAGDVRNADWSLTGDSGAIDIRGDVDNFTLDVMSSVKSLKLGRVNSAVVTVDGSGGSVSATEWLAGSLTADTLKSLQTKGNKKEFVAGDFSADLTLNGDPEAKATLPRAKVSGDVNGSTWSITGDAGIIDIRGTTDGWTLDLFSSVKTIKLAIVNQADLTIGLPDIDGKR